jgi:betaine-aldehyde dehydrogenase
MVLKPSPWASLTCVMLGDVAKEAGAPPGALNVITGGPPGSDSGEHLVTHSGIDYLSFTGSGRTGQHLLHASADKLRPSGLELGGKGAMIVFPDADLNSVVDWAMCGIFICTGQVCSATSRLIVHESIEEELMDMLIARTKTITVGHPLSESTQMGPVVSKEQHTKVNAAIAQARADGCTVLHGAESPEFTSDDAQELAGGYFVEPTILADVPLNSSCWKEEIFGPVLAVRTFSSEAEAVAMANDTPYGLANAVMSADMERCARVANELESGLVWKNCSQPLFTSTPFGGKKQSGFGREMGESGFDEYVHCKTVIGTETKTNWGWYA